MNPPNPICLHCGLLCELPRACEKKAAQDAALQRIEENACLSNDIHAAAEKLISRVQSTTPSLLRLDSLDVDSTRSVLKFARRANCKVTHTGSEELQALREVQSRNGWISSTLADAAAHADFILILSSSANELPLLKSRLGGKGRLFQLQVGDSAGLSEQWEDEPCKEEQWEDGSADVATSELFALLTGMIHAIQKSASTNSVVDPSKSKLELYLSQQLLASRSACIVWPTSLFSRPEDRLTIQRLNALSQQLTGEDRICSLLPFGVEAGMVTSEEVMLWTTGSTDAAFVNAGEFSTAAALLDRRDSSSPHQSIYVRSMLSVRAFPVTDGELLIAPSIDIARHKPATSNTLGIQASGLDTDATLFRGDKAITLQIQAVRTPKQGFSCKELFDTASEILASRGPA